MMYRVLLDGQDIYNLQEKAYTLTHPTLNMEINTAGSFEFDMPPTHPFYESVRLLTSTVEVLEDGELVWYGRPVEIKTDFWKNKTIYCEGALAYFNDTVQRPHEYNSVFVHTFFSHVVAAHNAQVAESRRFTIGQVTVKNKRVYRNLRYESTADVLKRQCLNAEGGYFFVRREAGVNYIDWLESMPLWTNQPVEFGLNLTELASNMDGKSIVTCVLPLGEVVEETGRELTVASVNDGSDVIESDAVDTFGRITKVVSFNGVYYPDTLYEDGLEYLQKKQFDGTTIECSAAELHAQNPNYVAFRLGQMVRCHSVPHLLDREYPLIRMSLDLDTAAKTITLGTVDAVTLTAVTKEVESNLSVYQADASELSQQVDGLMTVVDLPTLSGLTSDISAAMDKMGNYYDTPEFMDSVLEAISALDLEKYRSQGDQLSEILGINPYDPETYKRLLENGIDPYDIEPITIEDIQAYVRAEVNDYASELMGIETITGLRDLVGEVEDLWDTREVLKDVESLLDEPYDAICDEMLKLASEAEAAVQGVQPISAINAEVIELGKKLDNLAGFETQTQAIMGQIETKMDEMEQRIVSQEWRHQINGEDVKQATINFVTTTTG